MIWVINFGRPDPPAKWLLFGSIYPKNVSFGYTPFCFFCPFLCFSSIWFIIFSIVSWFCIGNSLLANPQWEHACLGISAYSGCRCNVWPWLNGNREDWSFSFAERRRSSIGSGRIYICCPSVFGWLSDTSEASLWAYDWRLFNSNLGPGFADPALWDFISKSATRCEIFLFSLSCTFTLDLTNFRNFEFSFFSLSQPCFVFWACV